MANGTNNTKLTDMTDLVDAPLVTDSVLPSLTSIFDGATVGAALNFGGRGSGAAALLDATQNADGSYTVANNGQVWAGPLSGPNELGPTQIPAVSLLWFNQNTGVFQMSIGGVNTGALPNGLPAQNGEAQGTLQGQIVAWSGDSILIKLYGNLDTNTGQLSDPLTSSDGPTGQAAYLLISSENLAGTNGIPTSGATLGQPTDPATVAAMGANLGLMTPIPALPVSGAGVVDALGDGVLTTNFGAYMQVTQNADGSFSAFMANGVNSSWGVSLSGRTLRILSSQAGGVIEIGTGDSGGGLFGDLAWGKIIGWNADGILVQLYNGYSDGKLNGLETGAQEFGFISETDLLANPISADSPEVFGQDPSNFPPGFGLAPVAQATSPIDPGTLSAPSFLTYDTGGTGSGGGFSAGHVTLTDATQNADGSYTLNIGNDSWSGSLPVPGEFGFDDGDLGIAVSYSNASTGAVAFSFTHNGSALILNGLSANGMLFGKIVAWGTADVLVQLYTNLDEATGALSNPVTAGQGAPYVLISNHDIGSVFQNNAGAGADDGMTLGQPTDAETLAALQSTLGVGSSPPADVAASAVDLSGLAAKLNGKSSDFGAFVNVANLGNGNFTATDTYNPNSNRPYIFHGYPSFPSALAYASNGYADFSQSYWGTDGPVGYTIKIDNVFNGGVFEWELDNPNNALGSTAHPTGATVVDHFFAKVIGYNAEGILVENFTGYSNGQLAGAVTGISQYAYFSTQDLVKVDIQDTPAQFGNDPSQLPNGLGLGVGAPPPPPPPPATRSAVSVFDPMSIASAFSNGLYTMDHLAFVDATQNADGSFTLSNNGEVWAGPLSGPNEYGSNLAFNLTFSFFNPNTGVFQFTISPNSQTPPNGLSGGIVQGVIVAWSGDTILIKLYGSLDTATGQLGDPLTSSDDQAAYLVISAEDLTATNGIPASGATLGQPADSSSTVPTAIGGSSGNLTVAIPAAPVDTSGMVAALNGGVLTTNFGSAVQVTQNPDGTFNVSMAPGSTGGLMGTPPNGLWIDAWEQGGIVRLDWAPLGNTSPLGTIAWGKVIGWNADGVLLQVYGNYADGQLSGLAQGVFYFIAETDLTVNPISPDSPEVVGQDPTNFPPGFGLAPLAPDATAVLDPATLSAINAWGFNPSQTVPNGGFTSGHFTLTDATLNSDGSYTLNLGDQSWSGNMAAANLLGSDEAISISISYTNESSGAIAFSFTDGSSPLTINGLGGTLFAKIVGWDGTDVLLKLYSSLDETTGVLSNPIDPAQGASYVLISTRDWANFGSPLSLSNAIGQINGQTLRQPADAATRNELQANLGIGTPIDTVSAVDLSGLAGALSGQSTNHGAFVSVTNLGGGNFSAADMANPYVFAGLPSIPKYNYTSAARTFADFSETYYGTDGAQGFTIQIDNVLGGGVFEWELDNPNPVATSINKNPTGPEAWDHFFAKVIGYNADGILVENYTGYSNGQLTGPAGGITQFAYFSTNDLAGLDLTAAPAQFGNDPSQFPTGLGVTAPCFAEGTRIRTTRGDIAVEQLHEGDEVMTGSGALRPVKWIGHRHVDCSRHETPAKVWPVRVAAGAFGPNLPSRDLFLSPDHALFVEGVLIPVKQLINDETIAQTGWSDVTYYHVELDRHDVLLAEGLPAESFLDTGNRDSFANGGPVMRLHVDFVSDWYSMEWEAKACAQLVLRGPQVDAAKAQLRHHAAAKPARRRVAA